jgi:Tol biopolymer transport system component/tetratricopeptide (TPR) repeat protein
LPAYRCATDWAYCFDISFFLSSCGGDRQLIYKVGGSADEASVTYIDAERNLQEETVSLPWETSVPVSKEFNFEVVVHNPGSEGTVSCSIWLDDRKLGDGESDAHVTCSGNVSVSGNSTSSDFSSFPVEAYLSTADEYYQDEETEKALAEIEKAIALAPNFAEAYFAKGIILKSMDDLDQALAAYNQALELAPEHVKALNNRGLVYSAMGDNETAIADFTKALELDPEYVKGYFNRAIAYADEGEYEAARADVLKVQELSDDEEQLEWADEALALVDAEIEKAQAPPEPTPTNTPEPTATPEPEPTEVAPAEQELPTAKSWIVFASDRAGNYDIYKMRVDGTDLIQLTDHPEMDVDPVWSPDGNSIVFVSERDGNQELYLLTLADGSLLRLTNDPAMDNQPAWSPNGQMIAFNSDRSGNADIWLINADGSQPSPFTSNPANELAPTWNPNEPELAFVSDRDGDLDIFAMTAAGEERVLIQNDVYDHYPNWSPNGRFIAFVSNPTGDNPDIYIVSPDDGEIDQVTGDPGMDMDPQWSPDSNYLLFVSQRDGNLEIYLMEESGAVYNLTNSLASDFTPAWGPMEP